MLRHIGGTCGMALALMLACVPEDPATSEAGTSSTSNSTTGSPGCQSDAECPSVCVDVIHVRVSAAADYHVRVSLASGPAGAPYKLTYRTLLQ